MIPGSSPDDRTSGLTDGPVAAPTGQVTGAASPATSSVTTSPATSAADSDTAPADAPGAAVRPRLQALAGLTVRGADGRRVGRVRDVYQHDASGRLAALTVLPRQLSGTSVLIPAPAIASLPPEEGAGHAPADGTAADDTAADGTAADGTPADGASADRPADDTTSTDDPADPATALREVVLRVDAARAKAGIRPPDTLHATPELLAEALAALGDLAPAASAAAAPSAATASAAPTADGEERARA